MRLTTLITSIALICFDSASLKSALAPMTAALDRSGSFLPFFSDYFGFLFICRPPYFTEERILKVILLENKPHQTGLRVSASLLLALMSFDYI